jgi:plasmid maintenance system antidote protein VapI
MENIVIRYFREIYGYTPAETAHRLGISVDDYLYIETGEQLLSESQAEQLSLLFNLRKDILLEAAEQLDLLLARNAIITIQKEKIEYLQLQLQNTLTRH